MSRSDDQRVADIVNAANELAIVTEVGRDAFASSPLHVRAAERLLEIIGEASNTTNLRHSWHELGKLQSG